MNAHRLLTEAAHLCELLPGLSHASLHHARREQLLRPKEANSWLLPLLWLHNARHHHRRLLLLLLLLRECLRPVVSQQSPLLNLRARLLLHPRRALLLLLLLLLRRLRRLLHLLISRLLLNFRCSATSASAPANLALNTTSPSRCTPLGRHLETASKHRESQYEREDRK